MTRRITVTDEVYARLRATMREEESVDDVLRRLLGDGSWDEIVGIWPDADGMEAAIEEGRRRSAARGARVADQLRE